MSPGMHLPPLSRPLKLVKMVDLFHANLTTVKRKLDEEEYIKGLINLTRKV